MIGNIWELVIKMVTWNWIVPYLHWSVKYRISIDHATCFPPFVFYPICHEVPPNIGYDGLRYFSAAIYDLWLSMWVLFLAFDKNVQKIKLPLILRVVTRSFLMYRAWRHKDLIQFFSVCALSWSLPFPSTCEKKFTDLLAKYFLQPQLMIYLQMLAVIWYDFVM